MPYLLGILLGVLLLVLAGAYLCYRLAFSVPKQSGDPLFKLPDSPQYLPYRDETQRMIRHVMALPYEDVWITSQDGLRLHGKYYAAADPKAPVQLMFHGYRSSAERDFCGGLPAALEQGFQVLLIDQRAHGKSQGKCLTFGVLERYDCLSWVDYAVARFGADCRILLYGMSMGATTVMMAAGLPLPDNVRGIVVDCGYTSPAAIIKKVVRKRHYPLFPTYALVRLGGRLFGGFDIESVSAADAMGCCTRPTLLIHGDDDHFVPCEMGQENFARCAAAHKKLLVVPGAGHGLSFMVDRTAYLQALAEFLAGLGL